MADGHEESTAVDEQAVGTPLTRREVLNYVWLGSMGVFAAQLGAATILFALPRFRAGEFGGVFPVGEEASLPPVGNEPLAVNEGKFWLVRTDEGILALYRVCTHLGCLFAWQASDNKFICPCHGSQFTRAGRYIQGPAPRSLDAFNVQVFDSAGALVRETVVAATEAGMPYAPVEVNPGESIMVDTGNLLNAGSREAGFPG